jgi:hypothetical protein
MLKLKVARQMSHICLLRADYSIDVDCQVLPKVDTHLFLLLFVHASHITFSSKPFATVFAK